MSNELGAGFLESVYERSLLIALRQKSLKAVAQMPINVKFRDQDVGQFFADILVEDKIILELKAIRQITVVEEAQVLNYLKASGLKKALLLNFGAPRLEYKRLVLRYPQMTQMNADRGL